MTSKPKQSFELHQLHNRARRFICRWFQIRSQCNGIRELSLKARLAIALHLFMGYCQRRGLVHQEIVIFVDYLWDFIGISNRDDFEEWVQTCEPSLMGVASASDLPFPQGFREVLSKCGVRQSEFRSIMMNMVEIVNDNLGCQASEVRSRAFLNIVALIADRYDVEWPRPASVRSLA